MFSFQVFPDRIGHKLQWPKNTDYINYEVRPPLFWPEIIFWFAFFIGWQFAIRAILHHEGFQCVTTAEGGPNAVEVIVQSIISRFSLLPAAVIFLLSGQGFTRVQTTRQEMARIRVASLEIAHTLIKFTNPPLDAQSADDMPLLVYEFLSLLTVYPVTLVQEFRGNFTRGSVLCNCERHARFVRDSRRGHTGIAWAPGTGHDSTGTGPGPGGKQVRLEQCFEILSLLWEKHITRKTKKRETTSIEPLQILCRLREHLHTMIKNL
ncbi:hypothetical protein LEL_05328 [Akanthomyces lecanii RCEF 1005]|uniref:Uncharacterized protein n=1 Tax=Akanthomyces lecanii RCEF 1005 TaxID=1081108 RepID=A0A162IUZ6_CORDF|nr:hypothetical protein LEL_05328 [Akanthomyces lecanii RCEF 1005]